MGRRPLYRRLKTTAAVSTIESAPALRDALESFGVREPFFPASCTGWRGAVLRKNKIALGTLILTPDLPRQRFQAEDIKMNLSGESLLVILIVGVIAGWLAGQIVRGAGFGLIGDLVVGVIGAFLASLLFPRLGFHLGTGIVSEIIYSAIGAIVLLLILRLISGRGRFA
jgi:uncharacterized membrane protein YeaQ/YmgE (transglycosylase-associated protein family)